MPTMWIKQRRKSGELSVFSFANAWKKPIDRAMANFNAEGFGVKLVPADTETGADIILRLSGKADKYGPRYGKTATIGPKFKPDDLHGQCTTFTEVTEDKKSKEKSFNVTFAVVFLPGEIKKATDGQKEMVVFHEFIHACGLDGGRPDGTKDDKGQDHDAEGIFVANIERDGNGVIEYLRIQGAKAMPPLRIGPNTRCKMLSIWGGDACKKE